MPLVPYDDPGAVSAGDPLPAAYLNTARDNGTWFDEPPQCVVYDTTVTAVADATTVALSCTLEEYDNDTMHSTTVNPSRIKAVAAGRYTLLGTASFAANATGLRRIGIRINGTTEYVLQRVIAGSAITDIILSGVRTFTFAVDDYAELVVGQTSGGSLDVTPLSFEMIYTSAVPS